MFHTDQVGEPDKVLPDERFFGFRISLPLRMKGCPCGIAVAESAVK